MALATNRKATRSPAGAAANSAILARDERHPANDDSPRRRGKADGAPRKGSKRRRGRGGGRHGGSRLRRFLYWICVAGLWVVIAGIVALVWIGMHLPPIQSLEIPKRPPTVHVLALDGRTLATRGEMGGSAVALKEMPPYLPKAFIAIEDRRFYAHGGIDPIGLLRAAGANVLRRGVAQGGSTITQQLAKNLFLTQERTLTRKLQEAVLALWIERRLSKDQILDLYLNRIYFGSGAYGVEAAAQRYFGKSARRVTLAEAALLAGLVKSPTRLAPTRNFDAAERRAQIVLAAMADARFIAGDAAKRAMSEPPKIARQSAGGSAGYVADWVMDVLNDVIGRVEQDVMVETSIDPALQAAAEAALIDELAHNAVKFDVEQGAIVAMTPDGAVRALVGGRNYGESQFNRAVSAKRQPGSAFKPFVYLTALERGLTPETLREDKPISIKGWKPENYAREYHGPVPLSRALAMSLNTVSVRLAIEVGPAAIVRTAHRLGISSKLEPNASIALGTSEVSLVELVSAYAPFARGGNALVAHVVTRVRTNGGKTLYLRQDPELGRVIDQRHVAMMNAMLRETLLTGTARKADLPGWPAAGKTGTSQDFRDAWFIGYTGKMIAGVWIGNDDSSPTKKATGSGIPVDIWSRFMKAAHHNAPVIALPGLAGARLAQAPAALPTAGPMDEPGTPLRPPTGASPAQSGGLDGWLIERLFGRRER